MINVHPVRSVLITSVVAACLLSARGQELGKLSLPSPATTANGAQAVCLVESPAALTLAAPGNSNLYISPDGNFRADNAPRVEFKPTGAFILTARIQPEFRDKWDAGALVLYRDAEHYAKFAFEADYQNTPRIVSVICNGRGDDCNSAPVHDKFVYYRIVGSAQGDTFTFYSSGDGRAWYLIRTFRLTGSVPILVGFSAQSPVGQGCTVHFSEISVEQREVKDFWAGN